jgi:hypothetical protein
MEATERSTSPSASTNIIVTEMEPIKVTESSSPWMLRLLTKPGTVKASAVNSRRNTTTMPERLTSSHVSAARLGMPGAANGAPPGTDSVDGVCIGSVSMKA